MALYEKSSLLFFFNAPFYYLITISFNIYLHYNADTCLDEIRNEKDIDEEVILIQFNKNSIEQIN